MSYRLSETCTCGASIEVSGKVEDVQRAVDDWRSQHNHSTFVAPNPLYPNPWHLTPWWQQGTWTISFGDSSAAIKTNVTV